MTQGTKGTFVPCVILYQGHENSVESEIPEIAPSHISPVELQYKIFQQINTMNDELDQIQDIIGQISDTSKLKPLFSTVKEKIDDILNRL